jgi:hypothetical protein
MPPNHKIVDDTGVLISVFAFGGAPAKAVLKAFHEATISLALYKSGKINHEQYQSLIAGIAAFVSRAVLVVSRKHFHVCRDAKDNMVLDCLLCSQCRYVDFRRQGPSKYYRTPLSFVYSQCADVSVYLKLCRKAPSW